MNKSVFFAPFLILAVSCDKIPSRIPPPPPECTYRDSIVNDNSDVSGIKKVLLEDYTGHYCGQCPPAAVEAEKIVKANEDRVIVLACHVSETFAAPRTVTGKYLLDLRDEASNEWDMFLGMSGAGLPKGTVNRVKVSDKFPLNYSAWNGVAVTELAKPQTVKLDVTTVYEPNQKLLRATVKTTFKTNLDFNVRLIMALSADSIVGDQRDYAPPAGVTIIGDRRPNYSFDHVMVKSINGTWGMLIKNAPIKAKDQVTINSGYCNLSTKCFYTDQKCVNDKYMSLIVFAYNENTKEVLQVEKVKIK